ncbi:hypothetical protein RDWZM_005159 [Blomia tropicalis]|uniref:Retinoblastoma-like protein 1 n=1 Tax=Blomia tropicalis TaxID=40697 RepID=A0A9Q0M841_BLOTA|nr:hypothetical protein RDWZM_005159 [Blomia tropicalis]
MDEEIDDRAFNEIRNDLNLDDETAKDAWNTFRRIGSNYSLEGEALDWIACSLYASCRKCMTPTIGTKMAKIEGNMVSLTRILRSCNISLVRFFNKMKNWTEMAGLPIEMRSKLEQLERNFNVTSVIFTKYKPIFEDVFKCTSSAQCRFMPKNRKQMRKQALTSIDIFTFCWTLFVYIKSKYSRISDDLVNSYHLLLVCIDYCFSSVLSMDNCHDIINSNFYEKLKTELEADPRSYNNDHRVSIIELLCNRWNGLSVEIQQIKKHWFKPFLKKLVEKEELRKRGNGIIENDVIDYNFKYLKREYENFVLTIGDFDECVFLNETASEELGTSEFKSNYSELEENLSTRNLLASRQQPESNHMPMTPLSSRQYLASRTPVNKMIQLTPISSATSSISRLHSILINHKSEPSVDLGNLFQRCKNNPKERIEALVKSMGDIFLEAYSNSEESSPQTTVRKTEEIQYLVVDEFPKNRLNVGIKFFYRVLEKILMNELKRHQRLPEAQIAQSLARIIDADVFVRSLFACSLEIVLYSYSPFNRVFPWILNIFDKHQNLKLHPFCFYKVIEPIIRDEDGLSREIVKHLNTIEEKILENLAWSYDSPVWALLTQSNKLNAPTFMEVSLNQVDPLHFDSPMKTREFSAKRQLTFGGNGPDTPTTPVKKDEHISSQIIQQQNQTSNVKNETDENTNTSKITDLELMKSPVKNENGGLIRLNNKKPNQLGLFFRKVYNLASLRLRDLFQKLQVTSEDIQRKIWTCLEHSLSHHTMLMADHHLDQLIMSSIFCICKINVTDGRPIVFHDIISNYRCQPQAVSSVYRSVLLTTRNIFQRDQSQDNEKMDTQVVDKYGNIIDFYNKVFIPKLSQNYIMKFSPNEKNSPPLSPMPRSKFSSPNLHSPLRRVSNYPIYISPLRTSNYPPSPNPTRSYRFQSNLNSSNDLKAINNMMKSNVSNGSLVTNVGNQLSIVPSSSTMDIGTSNDLMTARIATAMVMRKSTPSNVKRVSKRILQDDQESDCSATSSKMLCLNRKIQDIVLDRQTISASSSTNASATDDSNDSIQYSQTSGGIGLSNAVTLSVSSVLHDSVIQSSPRRQLNMIDVDGPTMTPIQQPAPILPSTVNSSTPMIDVITNSAIAVNINIIAAE